MVEGECGGEKIGLILTSVRLVGCIGKLFVCGLSESGWLLLLVGVDTNLPWLVFRISLSESFITVMVVLMADFAHSVSEV